MEHVFWLILALFGGGATFIGVGRMVSDSIWQSDLSDFFTLLVSAVVCFIVATAAPNLEFIEATGSTVTDYVYTGLWYLSIPFMAMALIDGFFAVIALISTLRMRRFLRGY